MKLRLDLLLVDRSIAQSRTAAQALIMAGRVSTGGKVLDKAGVMVASDIDLHVKAQPKYVSRAGDKLESAAAGLGLDFQDKTVLDVGSSTGGFTDYVLQHGAKKVYSVDVGTGQLAYKLRHDPRVVAMERTDIRVAALPEQPEVAVIDVSFISLTKVLNATAALLDPRGLLIAMAKPQFEAGRALADKYHGVIPLGAERDAVLADLRVWITERFELMAEIDSTVAGAEGNVEHFFVAKRKTAGGSPRI